MANQSALQTERLRRGPWLEAEDRQLTIFVTRMGERKWDLIAKASGMTLFSYFYISMVLSTLGNTVLTV